MLKDLGKIFCYWCIHLL